MIAPTTDRILCHCLRVTERQVSDAIERNALCSVREVMKCTGAGRGCMSCHARIKSLLAGERPVSTFVVPGCAGCRNPACACEATELVGEAVCLRTETVEVAASVEIGLCEEFAATNSCEPVCSESDCSQSACSESACSESACGESSGCQSMGCEAACGAGQTSVSLSFEAIAAQTLTLAMALMATACAAE